MPMTSSDYREQAERSASKPSAPRAQRRTNRFSCNERGWLWRITMRSNP